MAQAAKTGEMRVTDPRRLQGRRQRVDAELRAVTGARHPAYIQDMDHIVAFQQADERLQLMIRMPVCADGRFFSCPPINQIDNALRGRLGHRAPIEASG